MAGIPTEYKGIRFRSRLEATWAAFFDLLQWPWEYEPFDLEGYIPDFVLKFRIPILVEIKPTSAEVKIIANAARKIMASRWAGPFMACWSAPDSAIGCGCNGDEKAPDGWYIVQCSLCSRIVMMHHITASSCAFCGAENLSLGNDGIKSSAARTVDIGLIESLWATAKNRTQWKGEFGS